MDSRIENDNQDPANDILSFKKDILSSKSKLPLDVDFQPNNPYTVTIPGGFYSSAEIHGDQEKPGFFETARAEAGEWNHYYQLLHGSLTTRAPKGTLLGELNPFEDVAPPGWTPKSDEHKFVNIQPQFLNYVLEATGPKDQDYRIQRVYAEQKHDETLANGSFVAKLLGGFVGAVTDPMSYIPVVGWAKYAKFAPTFLKSVGRSLPGVAAYSVASSASEQIDKINGNLTDFFTQSFVNTVMGTTLFGAGGAIALSAEKLQLWSLNKFAKESIDGLGFKLAVNEAGHVTGFKAVDETGSLSAAKVTYAQDIADSSFAKMGVFKIPYAGKFVEKTLGVPFFGTPLIRLFNSPFPIVRAIIDRVADHNFITKGVKEGQVSPRKFSSLMNQEFAGLRALHTQMEALRLERNGFKIENRALRGIVNLGLNLKNKTLTQLAKDVEKIPYLNREEFFDEVREVMQSRVSSPHAPVNEAAAMMRKQYDETWKAMKKAYKLNDTWMPKEALEGFISRVYNTPFMNVNEKAWVDSIGGWLEKADIQIANRMQPINEIETRISEHTANHKALIERPNISDEEIKTSSDELVALKARKKALDEELQNEIRNNVGDNFYHVDDWNALSADEANEIIKLTSKRDKLQKEFDEQKQIVSKLKSQTSKANQGSIKAKTVKTAKGNKEKSEIGKLLIADEEAKLSELQAKLDQEKQNLQEMMHNGQIDNRLFTQRPNSFIYDFKDTNHRLKFRDLYGTEKNPFSAKAHAKAYYKTIMHQNAEDTINQVMGRVNGSQRENPLKARTLLVPDKVLREGNFLSKDLMASVSNYTTYLARRTHLKTVFNDVSIEGGFEPVLEQLNVQHDQMRELINERKNQLTEKLSNPDLTEQEKKSIKKEIAKVEKRIEKTSKEFETAKSDLNHLYDKMMGISRLSPKARKWQSAIMAITSMINLPFVPFTMINDISAIGLQHGMWPLIRDGIEPVITSIGGLLKGENGEALRKTAPSVHLALQDVLNGYADRNFSMHNNPYLNMGSWVSLFETLGHASTNWTGTNYLDNGLQHISGAVVQSELMRILHEFKAGTATAKELTYVRKYGIDPNVWADRMIAAFKESGAGKTRLGGYRSSFWRWNDIDAANELGDAVFRGIKDTQIQAGIADSPFWTDSLLGTIIKGFNGWTFASLNRYVIPSLQQPDAQKLLGVAFMLGTGALVSPLRRMARGETPYKDDATPQQILWQTIQDSGYFSWFTTMLADANLLTGGKLLGDLKNDRYADRTRAGLLGPGWGDANRMADIITALASGEWNEADAKKAARMIPFANASWTYWMSEKAMLGLSRAAKPNLPQNRYQAHLQKQ